MQSARYVSLSIFGSLLRTLCLLRIVLILLLVFSVNKASLLLSNRQLALSNNATEDQSRECSLALETTIILYCLLLTALWPDNVMGQLASKEL